MKISGAKKAEIDIAKWEFEKQQKIQFEQSKLQTAQEIELNALYDKLDKEQQAQEKSRENEAEELIKKYNNLRKITESHQKKELSQFEKSFKQTQKNIVKPTKSIIEAINKSTILTKAAASNN